MNVWHISNKRFTFIGGYFENGACPWASSNAVIPNDQISALFIERDLMKTQSQLKITSRPLKQERKTEIRCREESNPLT